MQMLQTALLAIAAIICIAFGLRYFLTREFMPYHATVVGKSWAQLEPGLQAIVLGMLKIVGGGFAGYGVALLWLLIPLRQGLWWAPAAVLAISAATLLPVLYVTVWLRHMEPTAKTPIAPAVVVLALVVIGAALSWVG
jgi:hypothetical protein